MKRTIRFRLNGRPVSIDTEDDRRLLWVLRTELQLTGTKYGCGDGVCGSCTVVIDGRAIRSCQMPIRTVDGKDVLTVEGLGSDDRLHPLQEAFIEHGALQCGYCTPGMLMSAYALLASKKSLTRDAIIQGMERNLCRCGAHQRIVAAIEDAAKRKGGVR